MNSFRGRDCALCGRAKSTRHGEHVLPTWLLGSDMSVPGAWSEGGVPICDRGGRPISRDQVTRVQLPACSGCNARLAENFETVAKDVLRLWFGAEGNLPLSAENARVITRWLLKTLILEMHPRTRQDHPVLDARAAVSRWSGPLPRSHYDWMIAGRGRRPDPPRDLSLWVYRREADPGIRRRELGIYVPTVIEEGGQPVKFRYHQAGWYGIGFDLVYHPGWPITHPLEVDGRAVRLWPVDVPQPLDLGAFPVVAADDLVAWSGAIEVRLLRGSLGSGLPPLAASGLPFRRLDRVPRQLRGWKVKGSSTSLGSIWAGLMGGCWRG